MNIKTLIGYVLILGLSFFLHAAKPANNLYFSTLPLLMIIYPIAVGHRIKFNFSLKDLSMGLLISAAYTPALLSPVRRQPKIHYCLAVLFSF